jgi:hypothetical protein
MEAEIRSQAEQGSWTLVKRPRHARVLQSRWVYKIKTAVDGSVTRFKARLVIKGYTQREGIDFNETFAPVCRYEAIRMLLSLTAAKDLKAHMFDFETAFLQTEITGDVYMEQPDGYKVGKDLVCKLNKSLYGLKQSPRAWYSTPHAKLERMGFRALNSEPCVYVKRK